jgi:cytoplasmic iron level regulating protein YaaA (DUF328/UPF0246 family)
MKNPLVLLSPSKGMRDQWPEQWSLGNEPIFPKATKEVHKALAKLNKEELKGVFKVSEGMFSEVQSLWKKPVGSFLRPEIGVEGLFAYVGEAFKFLDAPTLSVPAMERARYHLGILSAFYGVVPADQKIQPYRLEMQSRIPGTSFGSLYALWKPLLTHWVENHASEFVVDLCSGEYSKAVEWNRLKKPSVQIDFKQLKNGKITSVSAFSKQARGAYARWIFEENIQTIFGLASFDKLGYYLHSNDGNKLIFLREQE